MAAIASTNFTFQVALSELKELNIFDNIKSNLPLFMISFIIRIIVMIWLLQY